MEILLRIALRRYYESGDAGTEAEACQMLIEQNLNPAMEKMLSAHAWRKKFCWCEPVDNILKAFLPVFQHLYDNFGGTMMKPGHKFHMNVLEYENFALTVPLCNDLFV